MKAIGIPKAKRSLAKKVKLKLKFKVINETTFCSASAAGSFLKTPPVNATFGQEENNPNNRMGDTTSVTIIDEQSGGILTTTVVNKPNGEAENIKAGDKIVNLTFKEGDFLITETCLNGDQDTKVRKTLKYAQG